MASRARYSRIGCLFLLCCLGIVGCPRNDRGEVYLAGTDEYGTSVVASPLGGHYVLGNKGHILKLSESGDLEWTRKGSGVRSACAAVSDGGVVQAAADFSVGITAVKRDRTGEVAWTRYYRAENDEYLFIGDAVATPDGGCVAAAYAPEPRQAVVVKFSEGGDTLWVRRIDVQGDWAMRTRLAPVGDDGFMLLADMDYLMYLFRLAPDGEVRWSRQYTGADDWNGQGPFGVSADGGVVAVRGPDMLIATILRTDADGDVRWMMRNIGTLDTALQGHDIYDMVIDGEGRIVLVGDAMTTSFEGTQINLYRQGFIMQLSSRGLVNWTRTLGRLDQGQCINGVALTSSGDYITAGSSDKGIHVMRVRPDGSIQ